MKTFDRKMLDVGRVYNAKITFEKPVIGDPPTADLGCYERVCTVSAELRFNRSRLAAQARAENTRRSLTFIIRQRHVSEQWRILYRGEHFEIESVMPLDNDKLYLQIEAYKIENDLIGGDRYEF